MATRNQNWRRRKNRSKPRNPKTALDSRTRTRSQRPPLIVGIGASAGGLDAFKTFFAHLPSDSGMAFVLVQHLDPHQKSMLAELIGRTTAMAVVEAENRMSATANRTLVIPPNATMTIKDGIIRVTKPAPAREHLPIFSSKPFSSF